MSKRKFWANVPKLVQTMFNAQNGSCGYCGVPMFIRSKVPQWYLNNNKHMVATFEHIKPASEGGRYELKNGACVCARCNNLRGNLPLDEFFDRYEELLQYLLEKPARDAAKKEMNARKNGYITAWYATIVGIPLEQLFLIISPKNSYDIARQEHGE